MNWILFCPAHEVLCCVDKDIYSHSYREQEVKNGAKSNCIIINDDIDKC